MPSLTPRLGPAPQRTHPGRSWKVLLGALLFATATVMMQAIRKRTPELAVLKTLGFGDRAVFLLVLGEAATLYLTAAAFGLASATVVFPFAGRFVFGLTMLKVTVVLGLATAMAGALLSAGIPAMRAAVWTS